MAYVLVSVCVFALFVLFFFGLKIRRVCAITELPCMNKMGFITISLSVVIVDLFLLRLHFTRGQIYHPCG